jgi:uncharacterized membrane protein
MAEQTDSIVSRSGVSDGIACALAYITIFPAIVLLILPSFNKRADVRFHARQSIFLNAALSLVSYGVTLFLGFAALVGSGASMNLYFSLTWTIRIACLLALVLCAVQVARGKTLRLWLLSRLAERQAGASASSARKSSTQGRAASALPVASR